MVRWVARQGESQQRLPCQALAPMTMPTADFRYYGDQDKPFYQITYHLDDFATGDRTSSFDLMTKLDRDAMLKLLDALAKDGFLAAARYQHQRHQAGDRLQPDAHGEKERGGGVQGIGLAVDPRRWPCGTLSIPGLGSENDRATRSLASGLKRRSSEGHGFSLGGA